MDIEQPAWIEWTGGDCPVAPGTDCEVRFRNGYTSRDDDPEEWEWSRQPECRDYEIIAYRVWQTAWQAQAIAAGWSPSTAPDLATVLAFESGQESMRDEIERMRLDLDAKDALNVSTYYAGMKAGWNFCVNEDQINFAAAIASTEHIAELQRINAARQSLGYPA